MHLEAIEDGAPLGPKTTLMARTCHQGLDTDELVCAWGCPGAKRVSHLGNHSQSTTDSTKWIPSTVTKCHQGAEGQNGTIIEAEAKESCSLSHTLPIKLNGGLIQLFSWLQSWLKASTPKVLGH